MTTTSKPQMTVEQTHGIRMQALAALAEGGRFDRAAPGGVTVSIFYVAGGAFCRSEVRDADGRLLDDGEGYSRTEQFSSFALHRFLAAVQHYGHA